MATIKVRFAEVPTDVLVHLTDHGPVVFNELVSAIAPQGAVDAGSSVSSAVRMLTDANLVEKTEAGWAVTAAGRRLVLDARAGQLRP